jgi:DNA-binding transcriptional LysR family regulator
MDVHLRDLRYFVATAEEEHVTRAAERLFVSQPSLSKQLRALERQLGFALFERSRRGVALTPAGRALLGPARALLADWNEGVSAAREHASVGHLVVGMQTAVGRGLQRAALAAFARRQPTVLPSLRLVPWTDPTAGLADGDSDVAFLWLPAPRDGVDHVPVAEERRHVALAADSPLAERPSLPFSALLDEPFVALPEAAGPLRDWWLATAERGGRPPVIGTVADTADAALEAVASGLGVVLLAEGNAALYSRPGVVTRPVTGLAPATLALAWRTMDRRAMVRDFVAAVREALGECA